MSGKPEPEKDFFVSYNKADQAWAEWMAWQLEAAGYTTVIQAWDFAAGGNFVLEMDRAAKKANRTIAVLSPDYLAAQYTQPEWAAALVRDPTGAQRRLVPVRVRECQPDGLLKAITYVDLVDLEEPDAREALLQKVKGDRLKPATAPGYPGTAPVAESPAPGFPGGARHEAPPELATLREAMASGASLPTLSDGALEAIVRHSPRTLEEYRLARIAEWSQPKYDLDKRFVKLTLLLDQGPQAEGQRWQAQPKSADDLRTVLAEVHEPAFVVLGPPGCGKSTLLRRLELDLARDALRANASDETALSFFLPLNRYRASEDGGSLPAPGDWLACEWAQRYPRLAPLPDLLRTGKLVLLLDAVNEIPHAGETDYLSRVARWRDFLGELARTAPATRIVFSCRSLDYTVSLSPPGEAGLPHVRIEQLADEQVEEFLTRYNPNHGPTLWPRLKGTPQLDLFRSPFYLKMLLAQVGPDGAPPAGRAALFTGFVRQALEREVHADNPLFRAEAVLDAYDHGRTLRREWRNDIDLPDASPVFHALRTLAYELQVRRGPGDVSRVRTGRKDALAVLGAPHGEALLHAGIALQVLEDQFGDVFYAHQLLQEYFAARALAAAPKPDLASIAWRADGMSPSLNEVLAGIADSDPLPAAPATGWEETFVIVAAMANDADAFVRALAEVNLPLAGRCAAQPDVKLSSGLRQRLQQDLVARSRDPRADLRSRVAAARALGELGDPRFERRTGPHGDCLLPSMVTIEGGTYAIGSDEGHDEAEAPIHEVNLAPFSLGQFPVTNAEWRLFMEAGGYDDERWWDTEAAKRWHQGEGTAEGSIAENLKLRQILQADPALPEQWLAQGRITTQQVVGLQWLRDAPETVFKQQLEKLFPAGRQTQPLYWNDPAYNHPAQPVVGICWYEARAYCAWLSAQTGREFRLPSEAEWEAAARGKAVRKWYALRARARRYAWGDDFDAARCNAFETHVRGTTPIGAFPGGDTPEGLVDMTGNVWDWTSSVYKPYRYAADDGREDAEADGPRGLRGGSWPYSRLVCRCAYRTFPHPGIRDFVTGFRLCCAPPSRTAAR